jgi:hypothetical protein
VFKQAAQNKILRKELEVLKRAQKQSDGEDFSFTSNQAKTAIQCRYVWD